MLTTLRHAALAFLFATALSIPSALAQTPDAAARFAEAQALFDKGSFAEALDRFKPLADETRSPNVLLYVARSLRELGRPVEAYDAMQVAVRVSTERAVAEEKYAPTRDAASKELAFLALKVSHVVVAIADAPDGATVKLDDVALTPAQIGSAITVAPGEHVVALEVPGGEPILRTITVGAGESKTIALAAGQVQKEPPPPPPPPPPPKQEPRGGELRAVGFIAGGVGAASLVVGVITGLMANSEFASIEDRCGEARCTDPATADTIDSGKTLETVANVTLIGGAVLVVAAVPLVIFGGPSQPGGTASISASPAGGSVRWRTAF